MAEVELARGDLVAMVTDGVTEAASPDDEEFGEDRLRELFERPPARARRPWCGGSPSASANGPVPPAARTTSPLVVLKAV